MSEDLSRTTPEDIEMMLRGLYPSLTELIQRAEAIRRYPDLKRRRTVKTALSVAIQQVRKLYELLLALQNEMTE